MEVKTTKKINENGSYVEKTVVKSTPKDGFVKYDEIMPTTEVHEANKRHKGYSASVHYEISDPKITRPFSFVFYGAFLFLGIVFFIQDHVIIKGFGVLWLTLTIISFIQTQKDINKIARELKEKENQTEKKE